MALYKVVRYFIISLFLMGVLIIAIFRNEIEVAGIADWLAAHPVAAPLLFIIFYTILVPLFFPSTLLAIMGGALFGPVWGVLYTELSATLSATLCFVLARYISADWVESKLPATMKRLKRGVEKEGWRFVLMVRLIPWLPFALLNYALGVTRIHLFHLVSITALCILPRVIAYTYIGYAGRMALEGKESTVQLLLLVPLLLAVIALPYLVVRVWSDLRRYLRGIG